MVRQHPRKHIPKLRKGSYFPSFLEPRCMAEKALTAPGSLRPRRLDPLGRRSCPGHGEAIGAESGYEDQLRDLALRATATGETLRLLTARDVRAIATSGTRPTSEPPLVMNAYPSRSIHVSPPTPTELRPRRADCGSWSTGLNCSSRILPRWPPYRRSQLAWSEVSASTSRSSSRSSGIGRCLMRSSRVWRSAEALAGGRQMPLRREFSDCSSLRLSRPVIVR
jgi:hypothetical protein